jgi:hypothetical protein
VSVGIGCKKSTVKCTSGKELSPKGLKPAAICFAKPVAAAM